MAGGIYVACRAFKADGKEYQPGDVVPAGTWRSKRALLSQRWIQFMPGIEAVEPAGDQNPPAVPSTTDQAGEQIVNTAQIDAGQAEAPAQDQTPAGGEPAAPEGKYEAANKELLALSVDKIKDAVKQIEDVQLLREALVAETQGQKRKTAREAIAGRLEELKGGN